MLQIVAVSANVLLVRAAEVPNSTIVAGPGYWSTRITAKPIVPNRG